MTPDIWHMTHDRWQVGESEPSLKMSALTVWELHVTLDNWHLTCYTWHMTLVMWHTGGGGHCIKHRLTRKEKKKKCNFYLFRTEEKELNTRVVGVKLSKTSEAFPRYQKVLNTSIETTVMRPLVQRTDLNKSHAFINFCKWMVQKLDFHQLGPTGPSWS